jgi:hypothetical protein
MVEKFVHINIKQTASGQALYNLQHVLFDDFAIVFYPFLQTSYFKFVGLHQWISDKLVSIVLPNNPRL